MLIHGRIPIGKHPQCSKLKSNPQCPKLKIKNFGFKIYFFNILVEKFKND